MFFFRSFLNGPYFCQERRYEYYEYAQTAEENPAVRHFSRVAAELGIVIPVSFYEKEVNNTYNSVAVLDADGEESWRLPENTYSG